MAGGVAGGVADLTAVEGSDAVQRADVGLSGGEQDELPRGGGRVGNGESATAGQPSQHLGVQSVPVMVHPRREYDGYSTAVPNMRVMTPIKLEQLKRAVKEYAVALADGQGSWGDEQAIGAPLAYHKLDAGALFQTYAEAGRAAR